MSLSRSHFVKMLDDAIENYRRDEFATTVRAFAPYQDIFISDDGAFEALCAADALVAYAYHLLECWVDSFSRAHEYPSLGPADWVDLAELLREDIEQDRAPTDARWNVIYTEFCVDCQRRTTLAHGRFVCPRCGRERTLAKP